MKASWHRILLPSAALIALLVAIGIYWFYGRSAGERRPAPAFTLTALNGAPLSLEALRGKVVLLDFWATWCGPCRDEVPRLVELQSSLGLQGLQVVGISMDDEAAPVQKFYVEHAMNYPVVLGDAALAQRFGGVLEMPVKFLIDRSGNIVTRYSGAVRFPELEGELSDLLRE